MAKDNGHDFNSESNEERLSDLYTDEEIRDILDSGSKDVDPLFKFDDLEDSLEEAQNSAVPSPSSTQNPEAVHTLFYKKKQRLLDQILPGTRSTSEANRVIRDEITLFLNEGREAGRDSRQAYCHHLEEAVAMLVAFVNSGGRDLYQLYRLFRDQNEDRGYHAQ